MAAAGGMPLLIEVYLEGANHAMVQVDQGVRGADLPENGSEYPIEDEGVNHIV